MFSSTKPGLICPSFRHGPAGPRRDAPARKQTTRRSAGSWGEPRPSQPVQGNDDRGRVAARWQWRRERDRETWDFRGWRWCHTAGMANSQPPDPRVEKTWINDAGELFVSDGTGWLPYEDLPDWPGVDDPDSKALYRDA
jgi:hypothetical protein